MEMLQTFFNLMAAFGLGAVIWSHIAIHLHRRKMLNSVSYLYQSYMDGTTEAAVPWWFTAVVGGSSVGWLLSWLVH